MSAIIAIGFSQIPANTSNESGVRQGPLYTALFKLGPTCFAVALKTIRSFVKLWSLRMTACCGKYLAFPGLAGPSTSSVIPFFNNIFLLETFSLRHIFYFCHFRGSPLNFGKFKVSLGLVIPGAFTIAVLLSDSLSLDF